ncbi:MAG: TlpA disulfide reductase family protein [Rhodospirillales bacterium]
MMSPIARRTVLAAGATLAAVLPPRKPWAAQNLRPLEEVLTPTDPPVVPPDAVFFDAGGTEHRLMEFAGHGMAINLWATWCAPCVAEMPSLQALSVALAPFDIAVMPLSSDRGGADTVRTWFKEHDIAGLPILTDPKGALARAWSVRGLPTTLIVDRQGQEVARLEGPADWSSPLSVALIRKLVG